MLQVTWTSALATVTIGVAIRGLQGMGDPVADVIVKLTLLVSVRDHDILRRRRAEIGDDDVAERCDRPPAAGYRVCTVLVIARSADWITTVDTVDVLFPGSDPGGSESTVAVLTIGPAALGGDFHDQSEGRGIPVGQHRDLTGPCRCRRRPGSCR